MSNANDWARGREHRMVRPRREPLFPLEADDIVSRSQHLPPSPLGELLSDIDATLPTRAAPPPPLRATSTGATRPTRPPTSTSHTSSPARREAVNDPPPQARPTAIREYAPDLQLHLAQSHYDEEVLYAAYERVNSSASHLVRAEQLRNQQLPFSIGYLAAPPTLLLNGRMLAGLIIIASVIIIVTLLGGRNGGVLISSWMPQLLGDEPTTARAALFGPARPPGDYTLRTAPSLLPEQIDRILASYGSPAAGTGQIWYNVGLERGIDPAFAVAFFIHESAAGTAQGWAGLKPDNSTTHNVGNIICAGYATCYGRFRDYPSWEAGIADWYRLIDVEYLEGRGHQTVADIIPVYAPSFENDVNGYVQVVQRLVDGWRTQGVP